MTLKDLLLAKIKSSKKTIRNNRIWFYILISFGIISFLFFVYQNFSEKEANLFEFGLSIITAISAIIQHLNSDKKKTELSKMEFSLDKIENIENLTGIEKTIVEQVAQKLVL